MKGLLYEPHLDGKDAFLSFQTVAELRFGARKAGWGERRQRDLEAAIQKFTVVGFNTAIVDRWADLRAATEAAGRIVLVGDAWIAATALYLGCPVVTHNYGDFFGIPGLQVVTESIGPRKIEPRRR